MVMPDQAYNATKDFVIRAGSSRYWLDDDAQDVLRTLDIYRTNQSFSPVWIYISLPEWAKDIAPRNKDGLLVPLCTVENPENPFWQDIDWWSAAFHYLHGSHERQYEMQNGKPTHSYSTRLSKTHEDLYDYAWVNRIMLFLRRMAAHETKKDEATMFGELPAPLLLLTHDVDYVTKTLPLILKKGAFDIFKMLRCLMKFKLGAAFKTIWSSLTFSLKPKRYDYFTSISSLEKKYDFSSVFHFYGGKEKSQQSWLFDPSYDVTSLDKTLSILKTTSIIGLHPSFHAWEKDNILKQQKSSVEKSADCNIGFVRQHWLRFSFENTWVAQSKSGLEFDTTLMWNDRPGFRIGAALRYQPCDNDLKPIDIIALPTAMMDSHFFDYTLYDRCDDANEKRDAMLLHYLDEVACVHGEIAAVWHHRVFDLETDWGPLYETLLKHAKRKGFQCLLRHI